MALDETLDRGQWGHIADHAELKADADTRGVTPAIPVLTSASTSVEHLVVHNALAANHNAIGATTVLPQNPTTAHRAYHEALHKAYNRRASFPYLNVVDDFGAVGDDSVDNQTVLQTAFTAGRDQGLPVYVPPGIFRHSGRLAVNNVVVFGAMGGQSSILKGTTYMVHAIDLTGHSGPEIHNLTIMSTGKDPRSSDRGGNGVYVSFSTGYRVINCHIHDVSGAGIMGEFASLGKIRYCQIQVTGADGIYHTEGCDDIEISYNKTIATGDDAISATTFSTVTHDIEAHHNTIIGNWESRAMSMNGGHSYNFHDNHIDGGTAGLSITDHYGSVQTTNSSYTANTVRNINELTQNRDVVGGGALHLWNDLPGVMTGVTFTGNRIYQPYLDGVYVGSTSEILATVGGNDFYLSGAMLNNANTHGSTVITESPANTSAAVGAYPGDLVLVGVGGMQPDYEYDPLVVF